MLTTPSLTHAVKAFLGLALLTLGFASAQNETFYNPGTEEGWTREFSANQPHNVRSVPAPTRSGREALRMEARYGERDDDGSYHAEVIEEDVGRPGETRWYGFSTYVPTSWTFSEQPSITTQWWSHSRSNPPLSFRIVGEQWLVQQRWTPEREGTAQQTVGAVRRGEWTDWVVEAYWSASDDGQLRVWRSGDVVYERRGPNVYWRTRQLNLQLGLYVWPWRDAAPDPATSNPRIIYHDEVRVGGDGARYTDVAPGEN